MNPNIVKLLEPNLAHKRGLKCCECGMAYSQEHYKILKSLEKLSYFDYIYDDGKTKEQLSPVCHFCLKDVVLKRNKETPVVVTINAKDKDHNIVFYASDN